MLVNNAGVMHVGPFLEEDDAWTRRQVDVNLHGVILGMKLALPPMVARGSGHVVNVASAAAKIGVPREAVYAATKHAVLGLSESVRAELRGTGVELSVVMPGLVRTELAAGTLKGSLVLTPEQVAKAIVAAVERPRFDVYVPRAYAGISALSALLPRRAREALLRAAGAERATAAPRPSSAPRTSSASSAAARSRLAPSTISSGPEIPSRRGRGATPTGRCRSRTRRPRWEPRTSSGSRRPPTCSAATTSTTPPSSAPTRRTSTRATRSARCAAPSG